MTYDAQSIANSFLEEAKREGRSLTPLQVIKLVFIAHGWYLGYTGQPLLNEMPEAWKFGPVIPSLYHDLKSFGNDAVIGPLSKHEVLGDFANGGLQFKLEPYALPQEPVLRSFLKWVWDAYKHMSGWQLSELTHRPDTPWSKTWEEHGGKYTRGMDIPENLIKDHYTKLRERNGTATS